MYQVATKHTKHEVRKEGNTFFINEIAFDWDIIPIGKDKYHIIYNHQSYNAELITIDPEKKEVTLKINEEVHHILVKDKFDLLLEKLGMANMSSAQLNEIKAPMPGLILSIDIKEGDEVKKGDSIMILEAMKMENVLKSPGDGVVRKIPVKKGDSVEKNTILVQF
ncbi:MAG: acetyl-CoA carboxylase biotin carboxyl carrier protein subunit [Cyclobacteriaceae bacterium]|nr:acetyl-CoA carboxylase biotin carboxyl carrier protein subunit [Cyclobacteriaceae bacterium]